MTNTNKTLYIPLFGKLFVSQRGLFIKDKKAEEIWEKEQFPLKGKSKSKWLAYYMGIRATVIDEWTREQIKNNPDAIILHLGCGLDSRVLRVEHNNLWVDIDLPEVINERTRFFEENNNYKMTASDIVGKGWLELIPETNNIIVIMEGLSMYLAPDDLEQLFIDLNNHFSHINLIMDCYTFFAAKMSKYKNPINDVGVFEVFGLDKPQILNCDEFTFTQKLDMTPQKYIDELAGLEKTIFRKLYAGRTAKKLYKLYEYSK